MPYRLLVLLNCMLLMNVISCGGGGGGGGGGDDGENNPTPDISNSGLTGFLFSQDTGDNAYLLDASTGKAILIPNTDWENQDDVYPSGQVMFRRRAIQGDHGAFLVNAIRCKQENEDALSRDISCIYLQDYNGNYLNSIELLYDVYELQMSYDKKYIALFRDFNPGSTGQEWFEIYSSSGELLSEKNMDSRKLRWLRDGRIVYLDGRRFVFTKPYSTEGNNVLIMPDTIASGGWLSDFDISDDETKIAFTIATDETAFTSVSAKAYIMDINGANLRLLADVPNGDAKISSPTWSPDGKWILLEEGYVTGQDGYTLGTTGHLYVVPAEDKGKVFMLSTDSSARSDEVVPFIHDVDGPGSSTIFDSISSGEAFEWIP
jgi:hypothetical protein